MPSILFDQGQIKTLQCATGKEKIALFDKGCKNLVLEVFASGRKTYYFRYKDERGITRQPKLCDANSITLKKARALCDRYRTMLFLGENPFAAKVAIRKAPLFAAFVNDQYLPFVKSNKRSWCTDESLLRNHILPKLGELYINDIGRQEMAELFFAHQKTHKPGSTNRIIILCRYIFNCAIRWETSGVTKNPTANIPLLEENNKKERFLSNEEAQRLYEAVKKSDNPMLQYIVPMLILTGARKREVLDARWEDFDLIRRQWRIPMTKSGRPRHVPLSEGVLQLLDSIAQGKGCDPVFANPKTKKAYNSIYFSWNTARKSVGLGDVRMHDLRHSFASFLVNAGRSLYEVQKILGHTQIKTTQRYAHLSQDTLLEAANVVFRAVPLLLSLPKHVGDVQLVQVAQVAQ